MLIFFIKEGENFQNVSWPNSFRNIYKITENIKACTKGNNLENVLSFVYNFNKNIYSSTCKLL